MPTDQESRVFHLVWTSYAVLAMTDPELARLPFVAGPDRLERQLAEVLRMAESRGELAADSDPDTEAARLVTLGHGLGTSVLVGQRSAEAAMAVLRYHLDRVLPKPEREVSPISLSSSAEATYDETRATEPGTGTNPRSGGASRAMTRRTEADLGRPDRPQDTIRQRESR
ncbi:TetR family transcriptional regulator C-terminal domain-containing protein [Saccharomonospora xinjiangensis]|uniref:TetR family transcriptional regulator C-terminal domain-containing protein n=1 Tax=Saccharomonospora xinjiangensis TaxID=75294 RepID=UPI00350F4BDD